MRQALLAWVVFGLAACSGSSIGSSNAKVDDAGSGTGGDGSGGRGSGGRSVGGSGTGGVPGCRSDIECKGARICISGRCVDPPATGGQQGAGGLPPSGGGFGGVVFGGAAGKAPDASVGAQPGTGGGCAAVRQIPETIVVYRDAMVTDTVYTSKPVALFLMIDRTSSMVAGSSSSWNNATQAVTAFVNDPRTAGMDIGLGTFPYGSNNTADCAAGSDCGTPVVPIAPLPANGAAMIQTMQTQTPTGSSPSSTPTECGLRGMLNECLRFMANSPTGEQCVAVLITDGTPGTCDTNQSNLQNIVVDGHYKGVTTYALALPGADLGALNALAMAGGTNAAIDVSGGAQAFTDALNHIRQTVAITTTTVVTTPVIVSAPLPCEWTLPSAPPGQVFDPNKVNLELQPPGSAPITAGFVRSAPDCANVVDPAWYYDSLQNPTRILLCPKTCSGIAKNSAQLTVNVLLGCTTVPAM